MKTLVKLNSLLVSQMVYSIILSGLYDRDTFTLIELIRS